MISGQSEPEAEITEPVSLVLEIGGGDDQAPFLIPVLVQTMSMGLVTLEVAQSWPMFDGDRFRGRHCVLRGEAPSGEPLIEIKGKISWSRPGRDSQSPLSLGLQIANPTEEVLKRLSDHIGYRSQDIKGLWERYDQVRTMPTYSHMVRHFYLAGLVLLMGGVVLQFSGSPAYKMCGWGLWLLGSLGLAGKLFYSLRQRRISR